MGLLQNISRLHRFVFGTRELRIDDPHCASKKLRACHIEKLEERKVMASDLHLGAVYFEGDTGDDNKPDTIQVTFKGGANGSQMTRLVIDGDKNGDGKYSSGELFFDTAAGKPGEFAYAALKIVSTDGFTIKGTPQVIDGGQKIVFEFEGFDAGEKFVFTIDVDEIQDVYGPGPDDYDANAIVEGAEFQNAIMTGTFKAPHYYDIEGTARFRDAYDQNFANAAAKAGSTLDLPPDSYIPPETSNSTNRTAGAVLTLTQVPLPITLAGHVFHDRDLDNNRETGEEGISGVKLTLLSWDGSQWVSTGKTATTNSQGAYKFEGLLPGTYRVVETQPTGWLSVGSKPGTVDGVVNGVVVNVDTLSQIVMLGGEDGINYDFGEALPNSIAGRVHADPEGDCTFGPNDIPLSGVKIDLLNATGQVIASTFTDAEGYYKFDNLVAGTYGIKEHQPAGYFDGGQKVGSLGGEVGGDDLLTKIVLISDSHGVRYDFCEKMPNSISGYVHYDPESDAKIGSKDVPISGVRIDLLDSTGKVIDHTFTDSKGFYKFDGLAPGTYGVREHQPAGYFDFEEVVGSLGGTKSGNDLMTQIVVLSDDHGVNYNFFELLPGSIAGRVHADPEGDCTFGPNDIPLSGVKIELLDSSGKVIATTFTNDQGRYKFEGLAPNQNYSVRETQPTGYFQGGTKVGSAGGQVAAQDYITQILIGTDVNAVDYNFCEKMPNSISGYVHYDPESDAKVGSKDVPISGVRIDLLDSTGKVIDHTFTDSKGFYKFDGLAPGTYGVREHQPAGYFDFEEVVGSLGGTKSGNDLMTQIVVLSDDHGVNYNFFELLPGSIAGRVHADPEGDCTFGPNDIPLAGVTIELLDANGVVIATTKTNSQGRYKFDGLAPNQTYAVREIQPAGYFQGGTKVGSVGGVAAAQDYITQILIGTDVHGVDYNFCEKMPNSISGYVHADPEGDCEIGPKDIMLEGVRIDLLDADGKVIDHTFTDKNGFYKFDKLAPGTYGVREHQPAGYFDSGDHVGSLGGVISANDLITQIVVLSDDHGVHYDFCELIPNSISGYVHADPEGDCEIGPKDIMLEGVRIDLLDSNGNVIGHTFTNKNGFYKFDGLAPGTYGVRERQPAGYYDSGDHVGSLGGVKSANDEITQIVLLSDDRGVHYDFCELLPNSISGFVFAHPDGDCEIDENDIPLSGVRIDLLDSSGKVIDHTFTDKNGFYKFDKLAPGTYGVFEHQPSKYYDAGEHVGSRGGKVTANDTITQIVLKSADNGVQYNFCEVPGGKISGYVFQDGPAIQEIEGEPRANPEEVRDGKRTSDDTPLEGVRILLYDGEGNPILDSQGNHRSTRTNSKGYYEFKNLAPGVYLVRQIQPEGYVDSLDTPGTTGGVASNHKTSAGDVDGVRFASTYDVIAKIALDTAEHSQENNFSEVVYVPTIFIPPIDLVNLPIPPAFLPTGTPVDIPELVFQQYAALPRPYLDGSDGVGYTWHLSIVDAGFPRGPVPQAVAMKLASISAITWSSMSVSRGEWILQEADGEIVRRETIGVKDAIPLAGDFNGDGAMELGLYADGQWFIDLNGNGKWDAGDLWAKLGTRDDKPVVGDWDGDGKDDIGIYGPAWPRDPTAVRHDPGLPDPLNRITGKKKNPPPEEDEAALGKRKLQRGATGQPREDLIDHVFHYGTAIDRPVVGDWTGDGLRRIGIFYNGEWHVDIDGDGRFTPADAQVSFGVKGDIPVVGDWNGEGIERLGVFRGGTWILDTNGNNMLDAEDKVVQLGQPGDQPVVGDWNGDGRDEIGVYHPVAAPAAGGDAVAEAPAVEDTTVE